MRIFFMIFLSGILMSCGYPAGQRDAHYAALGVEPQWIRNGESLRFEDELWYPQDRIDILRDKEVLQLGEYKGVEFFIDRVDIRPYNRLYTKLGENTFRVFLKKEP